MTVRELLPSVSALPHEEKVQLMRWLADAVSQEEGIPLLLPDIEYPVWSPHDSYEGAQALNGFLEAEREHVK